MSFYPTAGTHKQSTNANLYANFLLSAKITFYNNNGTEEVAKNEQALRPGNHYIVTNDKIPYTRSLPVQSLNRPLRSPNPAQFDQPAFSRGEVGCVLIKVAISVTSE